MIELIFSYSVLTDIDSICIFFIFICKSSCNVPNEKFRDVLFEVIINNKILNWLDTSHKFCGRFTVRNKDLRKKLGYFAIENIDDPCLVTVAVNPKEYVEQLSIKNIKGLEKVRQAWNLKVTQGELILWMKLNHLVTL